MRKILLISDKDEDCENISALLKESIPECSVITVQSPLEGINKAKAEFPDIILLGIETADMNRYELCNRLKSDESTQRIPIIMMTDIQSDPETYFRGVEACADAFLNKPVNKAELTAQINMVLRINALEKEKVELERRLQQAQKMEAIGTLAGGIVHEFNNILFPIIGYTEMSMYDVPEDSKTRKNLMSVLKAADRAKELIQQILNFSRKGGYERKQFKIQYVIKETLKLLRASLPKRIEIRQNIDSTCGPITADPSEIQQILMAFCTNAYQAMGEKDGVLEVGLSEVDIDSSDLSSKVDLSPGSYLQLTVKNSGSGIDYTEITHRDDANYHINDQSDDVERGLGVVYKTVQSYKGGIDVHSDPDQGTEVRIYLPLKKTLPEKTPSVSTETTIPSGTEVILLVDDEEDVVEMMQLMLERLGYQVTAKTSSIEALEVFRREPEKFDLVITDQDIPHMTGTELIRELILIRPDIPIVLCTGYNEKIAEDNGKYFGIGAVVSKPVRVKEIATAVRNVLP